MTIADSTVPSKDGEPRTEVTEELRQMADSRAEKFREKGHYDLAEEIENTSVSKLEDQEYISNLKDEFPQKTEQIDSVRTGIKTLKNEITEGTEGAEPNSLLDKLQNSTNPESFRLSGLIKEKYPVQTVFFKDGNVNYRYAIIWKDGEWLHEPIKYKLGEMKQYVEDSEDKEELTARQKKKFDYHYIDFESEEVRLTHKPKKITKEMKTADKGILDYTRGEEQISETLFEEIEETIKQFWDHYDEEWYTVLAAWVFHTYLLQDLPITPYVILKGKKNTGKTVCQETLDKLAYNSCMMPGSTLASIQRSVNYAQSTTHHDEIGKRSEAEKKELQKTFNSGYSRGAMRHLVDTNEHLFEDSIKRLYIYSPTTFAANSLHGFKDQMLSRSFIINSSSADREVDSIRNIGRDKKQCFQDLRNQLFIASIKYRDDILSYIEKSRSSVDASNREAEKICIIHGILSWAKNEEIADEIADFLTEKTHIQDVETSEYDRVLAKYVAENVTGKGFHEKLKVVASHVNNNVSFMGSDKQATSRSVSEKMQELGFIRDEEHKSRDGPNGETMVHIPKKVVEDALQRNGLNEFLPDNQQTDKQGSNGSGASTSSAASVGELIDELGGQNQPVEVHKVIKESELSTERVEEIIDQKLSEGVYMKPASGRIQKLK